MIGVIADDLTGAAEIGAVGLRHGLSAEIVRHGKPGGAADVVCVDTDSRSCGPDEAGKRAAAAAKLLHAAGAQWIYKKVDSVLRGQVTAEVEAVMKQLQFNRALLLPANPSLGRVIREGQYVVRGKLIHKTEFAHDPEYPRRSPHVLRLLRLPEKFQIRMSNGDRTLSDNTIVVGEAETTEDVRDWAFHREPGILPAGGSEFFSALLDTTVPAPVSLRKNATPGDLNGASAARGRELFVCGTFTESARKFIEAARRRKTPVFSLPQEMIWGAELSIPAAEAITRRVVDAFNSSRRVILNVGLPLVRDSAIARQFSGFVVRIAESVLRQAKIAGVFAEGGATSAELVRSMGWARLTVQRELAPGVAALAVEGDESTLLTIKPGTYAWPAKWT